MAYILIDGYNLLGIAHHDLEKARNDLILRLWRYSEPKGHHITLVFDGWRGGQGEEAKIRSGNVTVIFTRLGERADHVIKRILSEGLRHWIVVSSDREIADFAWRNGFTCLSTTDFEKRLIHSTRQEKTEDFREYEIKEKYLDDIETTYDRQKGNARKPSKKERQRLRALKKL